MKKIITLDIYIRIRLCCLFAFVVLAQILPAWNYLKVYRNDGVEPLELYSVDVDSLVCSKIGIDSIMYADWQVQEIWTPDTVYRIPLAIIDSIQFKTVDTNIAVKNVVTASKQISHFFVNSDNLQDFATHLGEIKDFEQVEDAWMHGTSLFVKVRDWGTISFSYPIPNVPVENGDTEDHVRRNVMRAKEYDISDAPNSHTPIYDNPSDYRICIVNQTYNDLNRSYERTTASQMEANFKSCGFNNIRLVNGSDFGKEFINNDIYNYDIILMATHGEYDGQRHWIYSGKEYLVTDDINLKNPWTEMERLLIDEKLQVINSPNCISCGFVEELREIRGEKKTVLVCYAKVSELGFAKGNNKFRGNGTAVLFNVACQSLEENYALPNVWGKKGLGYYLGYTHSNSIGWRACMEFTEFLLNGYDVIKSKKLMSLNNVSERIDEYDRYGNLYYVTSNLVGLTKKDLGEYHTCIVKPLTLDAKSPFDGVLYGEIRQFDPTKTNFIYGFCTSKHKDMKSSTIHNGIKIDQCKYESSSHMVSFNINLSDDESLEAGPTYFCAYVWDGENYCFGDVKQFEEREMSLCPDGNHPHWIDLGLPSGTLWRCCNAGALKPEEYGGYYPFEQVSAAPTVNQIEELLHCTTSVWTTRNGINGTEFTGKSNGAKIFLPATGHYFFGAWFEGHYDEPELWYAGESAFYWSSTPFLMNVNGYSISCVYGLHIYDYPPFVSYTSILIIEHGNPIRPVR